MRDQGPDPSYAHAPHDHAVVRSRSAQVPPPWRPTHSPDSPTSSTAVALSIWRTRALISASLRQPHRKGPPAVGKCWAPPSRLGLGQHVVRTENRPAGRGRSTSWTPPTGRHRRRLPRCARGLNRQLWSLHNRAGPLRPVAGGTLFGGHTLISSGRPTHHPRRAAAPAPAVRVYEVTNNRSVATDLAARSRSRSGQQPSSGLLLHST